VLTPTHGFLANIFSRFAMPQWARKEHRWFAIGAMLPDVPIFLGGAWELLRYFHHRPQLLTMHYVKTSFHTIAYVHAKPYSVDVMRSELGYEWAIMRLDQISHTAVIWFGILFAGLLVARYRKVLLPMGMGALLFHLPVDALTHTFFRRIYLWPLFPGGLSGFVSHANPILLVVEGSIFLAWLFAVKIKK
jgi:hypothetical protein